jgi:hypothetical protein
MTSKSQQEHKNLKPIDKDTEFQNLITEISVLKDKPFEEKVKWFENNFHRTEKTYGSHEGKHVDLTLTDELFLAYSFANHKKKNPDVTKEDFIELQIERLENLIRKWEQCRASEGETEETIVHRKKLLKYCKSIKDIGFNSKTGSDPFIEELTDENLKKYNFPTDQIERIKTWNDYQCFYSPSIGNYLCASNRNNKIYTGLEAYRQLYFRSESQIDFPYESFPLMKDYYQITLGKRKNEERKQSKNTGSPFNSIESEKLFLKKHIQFVEKEILGYQDYDEPLQRHISVQLTEYLSFLNTKSSSLNENPIFLELIGLTGKHNSSKGIGELSYIPSILKKHNLTPIEAKNLLIQMKYSVSTEWRENVIPGIIENLEQISSLSVKSDNTINKSTPGEFNPIENLDKMIFAYQGFIDECEVDFPHALNDNRNDRIYALYSKMFDLEMYDVTHRAFQEIKKLPFLTNNSDKTTNYYLKKTNGFIEKAEAQIKKFNLSLATNFVLFHSYHETIGWLRKFNNELKSLLDIPLTIVPNETNNELQVENKKDHKPEKSNNINKTKQNKNNLEDKIDKTPKFNAVAAESLYSILIEYFDEKDHNTLKELLTTGKQTSNKKILFKGTGISLLDVFKRLHKARLLTCHENKNLENWIINNFKFIHKGLAKDFNPASVEKNISGDTYNCKNPIIEIENDKIEKVPMKKRQYTKQ